MRVARRQALKTIAGISAKVDKLKTKIMAKHQRQHDNSAVSIAINAPRIRARA